MVIRRSRDSDINGIDCLLCQVLEVHHNGRPDLFKGGVKKYTDDELIGILNNPVTPVFVAVDDDNNVMGYAFCIFQQEGYTHCCPLSR